MKKLVVALFVQCICPFTANCEVGSDGMGKIDVQSSWDGDRGEVPSHSKKNTGFDK